MAVRPPRPRRPRRQPGRYRDLLVVLTASAVLVVFALRLALAALSVETWTVGWRVVALPTTPFVAPLKSVGYLARQPVGRLTLADLLVAAVLGSLALLSLAALPIRRERH